MNTNKMTKFAELIIKECICDFEEKITIRYDSEDMDVGYGMEIVIDSIKQKFGIL
jgi:histidinol phosphatase-like enzyme